MNILYGKDLIEDTWSGYFINFMGEEVPVTFDVDVLTEDDPKYYKITMILDENPYDFGNLEVEVGKKIKFNLNTGTLYNCELVSENNTYTGECTANGVNNDDIKRKMTMVPPEAE